MKRFVCGVVLSFLLLAGLAPAPIAAEGPVVRAVMFYSPSCGHCHLVIENVLPPLIEQYKEQFEVVGVNIAETGGQTLYQAAIDAFAIPPERRGVPTLIIGDHVLVGSGEIPDQLPGLVASYLAEGGVDWPAVPGLAAALGAAQPAPTSPPAETTPEPTTAAPETSPPVEPTAEPAGIGTTFEKENWQDRFARDPLGNGLSVMVLVGMIGSVLFQGSQLFQPRSGPSSTAPRRAPRRWRHAVPPLVGLGLIVAGYLAYVETQQVLAVCGPVGDCNAVQQSDYALLLGFMPIAVLGVLGYVGIGAAWAVARFARSPWAEWAVLALSGMAWFGILFSIYLTFLEPFVIGATCAWCLTSAVLMTALFWLVAPLARPAWAALHAPQKSRSRARLSTQRGEAR